MDVIVLGTVAVTLSAVLSTIFLLSSFVLIVSSKWPDWLQIIAMMLAGAAVAVWPWSAIFKFLLSFL